MCLCVKPQSPPQVRPTESLDGGDVAFLVGEPAQRFTASRSVLSSASPVFEALFNGPLASRESTIHIEDVDPRAFEILLRHVKEEKIEIRSGTTALNTLYVAHKYLLPSLVRLCCEYLYDRLEPETSLEIYMHSRQYSCVAPRTPSPTSDRIPSAPPEADAPEPPGVAGWSAVLLSRCLDYIDLHAEEVLIQEAIEDLDRGALQDLLARDTLSCHELTVFHALHRWAERECRRQCLEPCPENCRICLGDLLYLVRYPHLSPQDFMRGPLISDLLTSDETKFFSAQFTGVSQTVPSNIESHLPRMLRLRCPPVLKEPSIEPKKKQKGWLKGKTPKQEKELKVEKKSKCSKSCFADSLIDVLVCIFD